MHGLGALLTSCWWRNVALLRNVVFFARFQTPCLVDSVRLRAQRVVGGATQLPVDPGKSGKNTRVVEGSMQKTP